MNKEALRSLPKKFARPAVPFTVGMMAFVGSFVDIGITYNKASNDANKAFPSNASAGELANAENEIHKFDQLIINKAHSGATNIDTSQIPGRSETMQALGLINQETKISQKREELRAGLANKSMNRQLGLMGSGFSLIALAGIWDAIRRLRRNENTVSAEPAKS